MYMNYILAKIVSEITLLERKTKINDEKTRMKWKHEERNKWKRC